MSHLLILAVHLLATIAKLLRPGGVRAVVAESLLLKHQLVISSRARRPGRRRCRMHGGAPGSGGPKGARNGNYKHGRYTAEMIATRRWLRETTREVRTLT